jgi:hypothetical protein
MKKQIQKILYSLALLMLFLNHFSIAASCDAPSASASLDVNNVRALLFNGGDKFWDLFGSLNAMYEIPKGSGTHAAFTTAHWFSARDAGGNLHTAGQTYRQRGLDFWPGRLNDQGTTESLDCADGDKMYTVYGSEINDARAGRNISYNITRWANSFAPYYDKNGDGIYDPTLGDYPVFDLARPEIIPGQMVWWVTNDVGDTHTAMPGGLPLGIEIQTTAYAYPSSNSEIINNSTIYRYQIQNKSANSYTEFRIGEWADFDLGNADDDYVGCDISINANGRKRNLAYCYNADDFDEDLAAKGYGIAPPAIGFAFINPGKKSDGSKFQLATHMFFTNSGIQGVDSDPTDAVQMERYLMGNWADGQTLKYGSPDGRTGTIDYAFAFPGDTDPDGKAPWFETIPPGDRRNIIALEPRPFAAGEVITVEIAYLWARDNSNIASREKLRRSVDTLMTAHENFFANFSTGVASIKTKSLRIYPNPSSDLLYIEGMTEAEELVIYASNGKVVMRERISAQQPINISSLTNGIYFVRAGDYTGKFVKQ